MASHPVRLIGFASVTPIPKDYTLDKYSIAIWRKAKQRRRLPDNDTEDWTGFFIVYSYGMWRDIFTVLKEDPHYLSDKGRIALCHYVTLLQPGNDGKPTRDYFTDEKLRERNIYHHPSRYYPLGIYSVRRSHLRHGTCRQHMHKSQERQADSQQTCSCKHTTTLRLPLGAYQEGMDDLRWTSDPFRV